MWLTSIWGQNCHLRYERSLIKTAVHASSTQKMVVVIVLPRAIGTDAEKE